MSNFVCQNKNISARLNRMLLELLRNKKLTLEKKLHRVAWLGTRIQALTQHLQMLERDFDRLTIQLMNQGEQVQQQNETVMHSMLSKISGRTKKDNEVRDKLQLCLEIVKTNHVKALSELKAAEQEIQQYDTNQINKELDKLRDKDATIKQLMVENPDLRKSDEFMTDLLKEDLRYIYYDKTKNLAFYVFVLQAAIAHLQMADPGDAYVLLANNIIEEITSPKIVPVGKYKIPPEFLLQCIRNTIFPRGEFDALAIARAIIESAEAYMRQDGELPDKYGKRMEGLYKDPKNFLLCHTIYTGGSMDKSAVDTLIRSACEFGVMQALDDESCVNDHRRVLMGNNHIKVSYVHLLAPADKLVLSIPKQAFDKQNPLPMWGADVPNPSSLAGPSFILPEFVMGYVDRATMSFINNPLIVYERKKYKYLFIDGSTKPINVAGV